MERKRKNNSLKHHSSHCSGSHLEVSLVPGCGENLQSPSYRFLPNASPNGQVLMTMSNVNNNTKVYMKKCGDSLNKSMFDQKRKLMHKEIERRRRDKINDWIITLSKQVPDCASDHTKQGQSKGGILAKSVQYIQELRGENEKLNELLCAREKDSIELERLKQRFLELEKENSKLKTLLNKNGN